MGSAVSHNSPKWTGLRYKDGPVDFASKAFYKKGPLQKNNKGETRGKRKWEPRAQDPCIFNSRTQYMQDFIDPISFELQALELQRLGMEAEDMGYSSYCETDDEGCRDEAQFDTLGSQTQQYEYSAIPKQIGNLSEVREPEHTSTSRKEHLSLPWHGEDVPTQQVIHTPTVISTSKWSKLVMVKACKAFGVNTAGFEHELLDMILRMDQRRQEQVK